MQRQRLTKTSHNVLLATLAKLPKFWEDSWTASRNI